MQLRLTISLALNALLLGLALWLARARSSADAHAPVSRFITNRVLRAKHRPAEPPAPVPTPEVIVVNEPFHWAQLESADYRVYIANLRAIGCPEATVRDIIIADVNDLFSGRIKTLVDEVTGQFWHLITHEEVFEKLVDEKATQLRTLDEERDQLFTDLFGHSNPRAEEEERASAAAQREHWGRLADFLPAGKRDQLVVAQEEFQQALAEVSPIGGLTGEQKQARRRELQAAHERTLRSSLAADEYEEWRLRLSPASGLRERLLGLDLSEAEVRAVAQIQLAANEAQAAFSQTNADFKARTAQSQRETEARTRELLGDERFAVLQRASDQRYEPIHRVTDRLELPEAVAAQAYELRRQADEDANRLHASHSGLSEEERQAALQTIVTQTRQKLIAALGAKGFAAYEKIDGGWMLPLTVAKQ